MRKSVSTLKSDNAIRIYTQYHLHQCQIGGGPSPINQLEIPRDTVTRSPTDVGNFDINPGRDGEIVVFDITDTE